MLFFEAATKDVFNVQRTWPCPNMLPTMVLCQAFCIIT